MLSIPVKHTFSAKQCLYYPLRLLLPRCDFQWSLPGQKSLLPNFLHYKHPDTQKSNTILRLLWPKYNDQGDMDSTIP